jgi:C-terminal processing protease CtpA/Prc
MVTNMTSPAAAVRHGGGVSLRRPFAILGLLLVLAAASPLAWAQRTGLDPRYDLVIADLVATPEGLAFLEAYRAIRRDYRGDVAAEALLEGAIRGMVATLGDPYVRYLDAEEAVRDHRAARDPNVVDVALLDDVGYLGLGSFDSERAGERFTLELEALLRHGIRALVIDLRGNAGGLVLGGLQVLDLFLSDVVLGFRDTRFGPIPLGYANPRAVTLPVAVLVDRDTASTAEIVAGALQTRGRARLYGEVTAGKGVGQTTVLLSHGGELRLVTFDWSLPDGRSIHGWGLTPDVPVREAQEFGVASDVARVVGEGDRDPILKAALRDLRRAVARETGAEPASVRPAWVPDPATVPGR